MTELSKGAQAVFNAVWDEPTLDPSSWEATMRFQIATAFRAAAKLTPGLFVLEEFEDGWNAAMGELVMIADELDPPVSGGD